MNRILLKRLAAILLCLTFLFQQDYSQVLPLAEAKFEDTQTNPNALSSQSTEDTTEVKKPIGLRVHFIDVGQGDSILIESDGHHMLIDAGKNDASEIVTEYLDNQGVTSLEYVIGTHPHEDHFGSLDTVINTYKIGKVILPEKVHTSKTYKDVIKAIQNKKLKITKPVVGKTYKIGNAQFTILSPNKKYEDDLNDWSVGIKLTYKEMDFILCGDATIKSEKDILKNGIDLSAEVLKISHHGGFESSSDSFLSAVDPDYAVIMSETDNIYGHPHKEVIDKIKDRDIPLFRTDEQGTLVAETDGESIFWNNEPSTTFAYGAVAEEVIHTYIMNKSSKKFHYDTCKSAKAMSKKNKTSLTGTREQVLKQKYVPCKICKP